jgi:hypothetical protein
MCAARRVTQPASEFKIPSMRELINGGKARSAYGAALLLADHIAGPNENKAKRVSVRFLKECTATKD